jgi:hypothetical protein
MTKQEIHNMMSKLPSQQESLTSKVLAGTMFVAFLVVMFMLPDLR